MNTAADHFENYEQLRALDINQLRQRIRSGQYNGHTGGLAAGKLQTNLAIVPEKYALDFMRFCQRNPKPCPLVGVTDTGDPMMRTLGDIDIRSDIPSYNVYRDGKLAETRPDIAELWQDDFVAFALGCSYTFERALLAADISVRHIERNETVPMYRTSVQTTKAGPFEGGTVVSMRPVKEQDLERIYQLCAGFPLAHGEPIHHGDPEKIGITDMSNPDWGDKPVFNDGEIPVFWACGVTPQNAVMHAALPLCITHTPGRMLVTDVAEDNQVPVLQSA